MDDKISIKDLDLIFHEFGGKKARIPVGDMMKIIWEIDAERKHLGTIRRIIYHVFHKCCIILEEKSIPCTLAPIDRKEATGVSNGKTHT
jgi:hypothetical protein